MLVLVFVLVAPTVESAGGGRATAATQKRLRQAGFPYAATISNSTSASDRS